MVLSLLPLALDSELVFHHDFQLSVLSQFPIEILYLLLLLLDFDALLGGVHGGNAVDGLHEQVRILHLVLDQGPQLFKQLTEIGGLLLRLLQLLVKQLFALSHQVR